ncbi:hypothetical protein [Sphingobacterium haloxyli]|nr:hypothetical protein [Sphingobacterium haloxyli]
MELQQMIHRRSSSIIKWIFVISILELSVGVGLAFLLPIEEKQTSSFEQYTSLLLGIIFRATIFFFIYIFFKHYRKIRNNTNTRTLLETILKTRQAVDYYIKFNIYFVIGYTLWSGLQHIIRAFAHKSIGEGILVTLLVIIVSTPIILITTYLMKHYYRILYRRLIHKLHDNYEELIRIEG